MTLSWTAQARMDLRAIYDFIARDSEFYASQMVGRLIERVERVSKMPTLGHSVHEFPQLELRETHQEGYRLIYAFDEESIQVITIVHMKQRLVRRRLKH